MNEDVPSHWIVGSTYGNICTKIAEEQILRYSVGDIYLCGSPPCRFFRLRDVLEACITMHDIYLLKCCRWTSEYHLPLVVKALKDWTAGFCNDAKNRADGIVTQRDNEISAK